MPNVAVSEKQKTEIIAYLTTVNFKCGCCGGTDFDIQNLLLEIRNFSGGGNNIDINVSPAVAMICNRCSVYMLLSAVYLGLLPSGNPDFKKSLL